jgi:hypothetical protein
MLPAPAVRVEYVLPGLLPRWLDVEARFILPLLLYPSVRGVSAAVLRAATTVETYDGSTRRLFALGNASAEREYHTALSMHLTWADYRVAETYVYRVRAELDIGAVLVEIPANVGITQAFARWVSQRAR